MLATEAAERDSLSYRPYAGRKATVKVTSERHALRTR